MTQWRSVFWISAGVHIAGSGLYLMFGSDQVQAWARPEPGLGQAPTQAGPRPGLDLAQAGLGLGPGWAQAWFRVLKPD